MHDRSQSFEVEVIWRVDGQNRTMRTGSLDLAECNSAIQQSSTLRYDGRMQFCGAAEFNSALRGQNAFLYLRERDDTFALRQDKKDEQDWLKRRQGGAASRSPKCRFGNRRYSRLGGLRHILQRTISRFPGSRFPNLLTSIL